MPGKIPNYYKVKPLIKSILEEEELDRRVEKNNKQRPKPEKAKKKYVIITRPRIFRYYIVKAYDKNDARKRFYDDECEFDEWREDEDDEEIVEIEGQ